MPNNKKNQSLLNVLMPGIILIILSLVAVGIFEFVTGKLAVGRPKLSDPNITKEGIEETKSKISDKFEETSRLKIVGLYQKPLSTPTFVLDARKLKQYLESNTAEIVVEGELSESYLYIKTGPLDLENESVFFWVVDNTDAKGHLFPPEALAEKQDTGGNEFLYDLSKLPVVSMPYSLYKNPSDISHLNVVDDFLNRDISYKTRRQYFVGAFVSTTRLPNQVEKFEIRYTCKTGIVCSVKVVE